MADKITNVSQFMEALGVKEIDRSLPRAKGLLKTWLNTNYYGGKGCGFVNTWQKPSDDKDIIIQFCYREAERYEKLYMDLRKTYAGVAKEFDDLNTDLVKLHDKFAMSEKDKYSYRTGYYRIKATPWYKILWYRLTRKGGY